MIAAVAKWTAYGRWSENGRRCYALMDHAQLRAGDVERMMYEVKDNEHGKAAPGLLGVQQGARR